jgi:uncharacterized phage protein gp47/JayE
VPGLTTDGFVQKSLQDILDSMVAKQRATIDAGIDTSAYSLIGQLNGIVASEVAELWELGQELYDGLDPDAAVGQQQDSLYSLTGTLRRAATYSTVIATVTLDAGADIAPGDAVASVLGHPTARFANRDRMTNPGPTSGPFSAVFVATATGPVAANAHQLTVRETSPTGWSSIDNPTDAELGSDVELDSSFRLRRVRELAAQGGGTQPGIRADLLQLPTVRAAQVIENTTDATVDGLPPKSFEAIVRSSPADGSDDAAIANSIWGNKAAGMQAFGTVSVTVTDSQGLPHVIQFSRPTERPVYVALRLKTNADYIGDDAAKTALVAAAETPDTVGYLELGADVYAGRLIAAAMTLAGVLNADVRLSFAPITDFDSASVSLDIGEREIATLDTSRITIGPFP